MTDTMTLGDRTVGIRRAYEAHGSMVFTLCRRFLDDDAAAATTRDVFVAVAATTPTDHRGALLDEAERRLAAQADHAAVADAVERVRVADGLRYLTEPRRTLLTLALVRRLDHAEVAVRTSTPVGTVGAEIRSALGALRRQVTAPTPA